MCECMRHSLFLIGRAIFGGYFVYNGINHFKRREQMSGYAASKGTPSPDAAVLGSGAMLVAGGLSVVSGVKPRQGLAAIVGFLLPVSLQMHRFWDVQDPMSRQGEFVNFTKNIALAGAALALMDLPEPWPASVARRRTSFKQTRTTYPLLSPRELRELPA
jgi:putative oxidoreductase